MYTDSHTHIYSEEFGTDQVGAVQRALDKGVSRLYMPNIDSSSVVPMLELADRFPESCFPMMGLHPTSVKTDYKDELKQIEKYLAKRPYAAIGEIGIDLYWDKTYIREQKEVFALQLRWAREMSLPVVIHSRESFAEIFEVLEREQDGSLSGVFHSFTGNEEDAKRALSFRFMLGINGIVTFKNSTLPTVLRSVSPEKLLIETDSPYLSPVPYRGKRNESAYLLHTAGFLAGLYSMQVEEFARITTNNALSLFKLA